jgi:hypothetical protein
MALSRGDRIRRALARRSGLAARFNSWIVGQPEVGHERHLGGHSERPRDSCREIPLAPAHARTERARGRPVIHGTCSGNAAVKQPGHAPLPGDPRHANGVGDCIRNADPHRRGPNCRRLLGTSAQ